MNWILGPNGLTFQDIYSSDNNNSLSLGTSAQPSANISIPSAATVHLTITFEDGSIKVIPGKVQE